MRFSRSRAIIFIIIFEVLYYSWILLIPSESSFYISVSDAIQLLAPMIASWWLFSRYRVSQGKDKRFWLLVLLGTFSYVIAQFVWSYQEIYLRVNPVIPGLADFFWVAQSLFYLSAITYKLIQQDKQNLLGKSILDIAMFITAAGSLSWEFIIQPIMAGPSNFQSEQYLYLYLFYSLVNLALFLATVIIYMFTSSVVDQAQFLLFIGGFLCKAVANQMNLFLMRLEEPTSYFGGLMDPVWSLGLLLIGLASFYQEGVKSTAMLLHSRFTVKERQSIVAIIPFLSAMLLFSILIAKVEQISAIRVGCIVVVVLVVIRQMIAMKEKRQDQTALLEAEARYRGLVEESPVGVFVVQSGKLVYVNPRFAEVFGCTVEQMEQSYFFEYIQLEKRDEVRKVIGQCMDGEHVPHLQTIGISVEKSILYLDAHFALTIYKGKLAVTGTLQDITERKNTEELLWKSDKLSVVGELAAGIAHEIRNPLTSLKGFVQLLEGEGKSKSQYYQIMNSEIDRINHIVNDFLTLAKPQMNKVVHTSVEPILTGVVSLLEPQLLLLDMKVHVRFAKNLPLVSCEVNQMKQLFINILKNSMEAMHGGGVIRISVKRKNEQEIVIRFLDHGCGILPERIEKLGEPFYTTKEKGTGLGLMICYKIVEAHKGRIRLGSKLGKGTLVDVILPSDQLDVSDAASLVISII